MMVAVTEEEGLAKGRTQKIMEAMPSSKQAMGAGGSSTYEVQHRLADASSANASISLSLLLLLLLLLLSLYPYMFCIRVALSSH